MYTEVLRAISGIEVYPVLSLILFVVVFAAVLIRTSRMDRRTLDEFARLPLDEPDIQVEPRTFRSGESRSSP